MMQYISSSLAVAALATTTLAQFGVNQSSYAYSPDVAYNKTIDRYLSAWVSQYSIETDALYGRVVRSNGTFQGGEFVIDPGPAFTWAYEPHIASVQTGRASFVVASIGGGTFGTYPLLNSVTAQGGASAGHFVVNISDRFSSVDVGGEATAVDDKVVVVTHNITKAKIQAIQVDADRTFPGAGSYTGWRASEKTVDLASGSLGEVAISSSGGQPGRYLITWSATTAGNAGIYGAIVDRDLRVLVSNFPIAQTSAQESDAEVDGDGTNWVVAYESKVGNLDSDIVCRGVTYDSRSGTAYVSGAVVVEGDNGEEERDPTVRWTGESYHIGFAERVGSVGSAYDLYSKSVEFLGCAPCEGEAVVALGLTLGPWWADEDIRIAAGPGRDGGLIVWSEYDSSARNPNVFASMFQTSDGTVFDLGGGCGDGGTASATCAALGAPALGMRLQHAAATTSGWLVLGVKRLNFACGPCNLVPNPVATVPIVTDARGNAQVSLQLGSNPSLRGLSLLAQWLVAAPGGCIMPFSNGLEVTIE